MIKSLIKFNPVTGEIENIPNKNLEAESEENISQSEDGGMSMV